MPASTTHRLLGELVELGLLDRLSNRRYRIGLRLWELAVRTPGALGIRETAMPMLRTAQAAIGQHTQLGVLQGDEVLYLERLSAPRPVINLTVVGGRLPFYSTSSGLVLAAFSDSAVRERLSHGPFPPYRYSPRPSAHEMKRNLERIRDQGYATTVGFIDPAAAAIAVPVLGPMGAAIAAISAVVPSADTREPFVLSVLRPAALAVGEALRRRYAGSDELFLGSVST
jgi:DNA-binding IclR family transcriptional regulator